MTYPLERYAGLSGEDTAWWRVWDKRRDVDDWRQSLAGVGRKAEKFPEIWSLDVPHAALHGYSLAEFIADRHGEFEDVLCESLDAINAFERLTPYRQVLLALRCLGWKVQEIAAGLNCSVYAVSSSLVQARAQMKEACRVA